MRSSKLRQRNIMLRQKRYLQKQFLIQQKNQFDEFDKFKKELETIKSDKNKKKSALKIPTQGDNTNDITEKENEEEDIDYSSLLSNLDQLYKKIQQGNIKLVIDKKPSE